MLIHQAYRFRVYPTGEQEALLWEHCRLARFAFNWALRKRIDWWTRNGTLDKDGRAELRESGNDPEPNAASLSRLWTQTHSFRKDPETGEFWFHEKLERSTVTYALKAVDDAFRNFFRRVKIGAAGKKGFPRFKRDGKSRDAFTLQDQKFKMEPFALKVGSKIGMLATRPLEAGRGCAVGERTERLEGRCLRLNISRTADRWFCTVMVEREREDPVRNVGPVVGVDLGITSEATLAADDIDKIAPPLSLERQLRRLQHLSRKLSRQKIGSGEFLRTKRAIQRLHMRVVDDRQNHLHHISKAVTSEASLVVVEGYDLHELVSQRDGQGNHVVETRVQRRHFADNALGELRRQVEYKGKWYGTEVLRTAKDRATNRTCSKCGHQHDPDRKRDRAKIFLCLACGHKMPRQENTATYLARIGRGELPL